MQTVNLILFCLLPSVIYGDILGRLGNFQFQKSLQFNPENVQELSQKEINLQKYYKNFKFHWEKDSKAKSQEERGKHSSEEQFNQNKQNQDQNKQQNISQEDRQIDPNVEQQNENSQRYSLIKGKQQQNKDQVYQQYENINEEQHQQSQEEQQNDQQYRQDQQYQQNQQYQQKQKRNNQQYYSNEDFQQQSSEEQQYDQNQYRNYQRNQINQQEQHLRKYLQQKLDQQPIYPGYLGYEQKYVQQYNENPIEYFDRKLSPQVTSQVQKYVHWQNRNIATPFVIIPNYIQRQLQIYNNDDNNNMWIKINPLQQSVDAQQASLFDDAYQSMQKVKEEEKIQFHNAVMASTENNEEIELNATQMIQKQGKSVEQYVVKTNDGYYLTVLRIPPQQQISEQNEVVFLMHGLFGSADDWLISGPGNSLAFALADAGYDVYLGNARGSKYSRKHVSKNSAQADFWQFSLDEIATQDLPAMLNFILKTSGRQQIYYAGHSLGATAMLALAASQPQYNDKIKTMFALAPIVSGAHNKSPFFKMIAEQDLSSQLGDGQFCPSQRFLQTAGGQLCETVTGCAKLCSNPAFVVTGVNLKQLNPKKVPTILAHADTTSMRVLKQIGQWIASGDFRKFDYGADVNQQIYDQRMPQSYKLEAVTMPVKIFYSTGDWLAQPEDMQILETRLPEVQMYRVPEQLAHGDFLYSNNVHQKLMNII